MIKTQLGKALTQLRTASAVRTGLDWQPSEVLSNLSHSVVLCKELTWTKIESEIVSKSPQKREMDLELHQQNLTEIILLLLLPTTLLKTQTSTQNPRDANENLMPPLHAPLWESLSELLPSGHSTSQPADSVM